MDRTSPFGSGGPGPLGAGQRAERPGHCPTPCSTQGAARGGLQGRLGRPPRGGESDCPAPLGRASRHGSAPASGPSALGCVGTGVRGAAWGVQGESRRPSPSPTSLPFLLPEAWRGRSSPPPPCIRVSGGEGRSLCCGNGVHACPQQPPWSAVPEGGLGEGPEEGQWGQRALAQLAAGAPAPGGALYAQASSSVNGAQRGPVISPGSHSTAACSLLLGPRWQLPGPWVGGPGLWSTGQGLGLKELCPRLIPLASLPPKPPAGHWLLFGP